MIQLFDTLTDKKVVFKPLVPGKVSMYVCGPTVYNSAHIGHARPEMTMDMVRRWMKFSAKLESTLCRNFTDVEDKIMKRAGELGEAPEALARRYELEYVADMDALGIWRPELEPRVSDTIPQILDLIKNLIAGGKAYPAAGDVYFSVASFAGYGKLSGQSVAQLESGARIEPTEQKRAPADFALWKAAKPGEPSWQSPWGPGRPGWHIECSAMAAVHLGQRFDLHGGGRDLIFPHHENEIAQSQALGGEHSFAQHWVHNGLINFNGEKMSKSLGNFFLLSDLVKRFDRETFRLFMLLTHYRSPINFEVEVVTEGGKEVVRAFTSLEDAERRLDYFYTTLKRLRQVIKTLPTTYLGKPNLQSLGQDLKLWDQLEARMRAAMDDDFNSALALAELGEGMKLANRWLDTPKIPLVERHGPYKRLLEQLEKVPNALGLLVEPDPDAFLLRRRSRLAVRRGIDQELVDRRVKERDEARAQKDFARADAIRAEMTALGVEVMDGPTGATWRVLDRVSET